MPLISLNKFNGLQRHINFLMITRQTILEVTEVFTIQLIEKDKDKLIPIVIKNR